MLTCEQTKTIENALGADKAAPILEAFQSSDQRVISALLAEVATKEDLAKLEGKFEARMGQMEARLVKLEPLLKVLIGIMTIAATFFSPVTDKLLSVLLK